MSDQLTPVSRRKRRTARGILAVLAGGTFSVLFSATAAHAAASCTVAAGVLTVTADAAEPNAWLRFGGGTATLATDYDFSIVGRTGPWVACAAGDASAVASIVLTGGAEENTLGLVMQTGAVPPDHNFPLPITVTAAGGISDAFDVLGQTVADSLTFATATFDINGATAGTGTFTASAVEQIFVNGDGGADVIDATGFTPGVAFGDAPCVPFGDVAASTFRITCLEGGAGDDSILGTTSAFAGGSDYIEGNAGSDVIDGNRGTDRLDGGPDGSGSDKDTISHESSAAGWEVDLTRNITCDPAAAIPTLFAVGATNTNCTAPTEFDDFFNFENIRGSTGPDVLQGDAGDNSISGLGGSDTLNGRLGSDTIDGGLGDPDTLTYFDAPGGVTLSLASAGAQVTGGSGTDTVTQVAVGDSTIENLDGSAFADSLTGDDMGNLIRGLGGADTANGGPGADFLYGDDGGTTSVQVSPTGLLWSTSGFGNDNLNGGTGADLLEPGYGDDIANGGGGPADVDTVSYDGYQKGLVGSGGFQLNPGVTVSLLTSAPQNTVVAGTDQLIDFDNVTGSDHDDTLTGSDASNTITGGLGSDMIDGALADDVIVAGGPAAIGAGIGGDTCIYVNAFSGVTANLATGVSTGGGGNDTGLASCENLWGSAFNDTLTGDARDNILRGSGGDDALNGAGEAGFGDYADYRNAPSAVTVNLNLSVNPTGGAGTDTFTMVSAVAPIDSTIENVIGSPFNDFLTGDSTGNDLLGQDGNDDLRGLDGSDELGVLRGWPNFILAPVTATDPVDNTEAGNDVMEGGLGDDFMTGGTPGECSPAAAGCGDTVEYRNATSGCTVDISLVVAQATGCAGADDLSTYDATDLFENLIGSNFNDTLLGNMYNNFMQGLTGNDVMTGGVTGLATSGNDVMEGNAGNDDVSGFDGRDWIWGNEGNDELNGDAGGAACGASSGICDDHLYGGAGSDDVFGQEGNDWMEFVLANDGSTGNLDTYDGGTGLDTLCANTACGAGATDSAGIFADLISQTLNTYAGALRNMENVHAGTGNDDLLGNGAANILTGEAGNDVLFGRADDDSLIGGEGDDDAFGGGNDDSVLGGAGADLVSGDGGNDFVSGGTENDHLAGGSGDDIIRGGDGTEDLVDFGFEGDSTGVHANLALGLATGDISGTDSITETEDIRGTLGPDVFRGDAGSNWIRGLRGNDRIDGLAGDDILDGNAGADNVRGNGGNDTMYGAAGDDLMNGGSGEDLIIGGTGRDTIRARDGEADFLNGRRGRDTCYVDAIDTAVSC